MRIFSKFHDYYDSARGYGFDPKIVWDRRSKICIVNSFLEKAFDEIPYLNSYTWSVDKVLIGFCGKLHACWNIGDKFFYCVEDVVEYLRSNRNWFHRRLSKREYEKALKEALGNRFWTRKAFSASSVAQWELKYKIDLSDVFVELDTPTFIVQKNKHGNVFLEANPQLSRFNFQKKFSPWEAFQELSMYVGNILLNRQDLTPKVSNKDLLECKGFDKFSFRKGKQK